MKKTRRVQRWLAPLAPRMPLASLALLAAGMSGCATPTGVEPVPDALKPPAGQRLLASLDARGVQIYECRAAGGGAPAWALVAPDAQLFDAAGKTVGTHGAGPHWRADDGSRVDARPQARADAPRPGAIPWLLLTAQPTGAPGLFGQVTSIQRLATDGGVAPADGCGTTTLGAQTRVPYKAVYRFYVPS